MITRPGIAVALLAAGVAILPPAPAAAQAARSLDLDPSARSAGMGGASTAVIGSGDENGWANPAMLGYASGFRYRWTNSRLVPDLAPDVTFQTDRFSYGWGGVGLAVESQTLDYGRIELTDSQGRPIGTYEPTESVRPLSGGISLSRGLDAVASLRGGVAPRLTRYADVAVGFSRKPVQLLLAPAGYGGEARTVASDFGLLVRATPLPATDIGRPFLDVTYGFAALNHNDVQVIFLDESEPGYVLRHYRHGIAARIAFPLSEGTAAGLEQRFGRWIARGMDPLVSVVVAADSLITGWGRNGPMPTASIMWGWSLRSRIASPSGSATFETSLVESTTTRSASGSACRWRISPARDMTTPATRRRAGAARSIATPSRCGSIRSRSCNGNGERQRPGSPSWAC